MARARSGAGGGGVLGGGRTLLGQSPLQLRLSRSLPQTDSGQHPGRPTHSSKGLRNGFRRKTSRRSRKQPSANTFFHTGQNTLQFFCFFFSEANLTSSKRKWITLESRLTLFGD